MVASRHPEVVDAVVAAYRHYWTMLLQAAKPGGWEQFDVTTAHLKCLVVVAVRETPTISQVAEILGMGRSSASITIDQLVQRGLVTRTEDPDDRRRTIVRLAAHGHSLLQHLNRSEEEFMRGCFERLDKDALIALRVGLTALAQVMGGAE